MFNLNNKTAVITGGGSGIGRAISLLFAQQGAIVHILELNSENAESLVREVKAAGKTAVAHACNVANQQEVKKVFEDINGIDILVNNAGVAHIGKADTTPEADFDRLMTVNVKGVYNCIHCAIPELRKKGGGVIINMASVAALVGIPDRFAYTTTKG